jgi:hydrogenase/urease accessory protein HupE
VSRFTPCLGVCVLSFLVSSPVFAHALNPGYLSLQTEGNRTEIQWSPPTPATADPVPGEERLLLGGPILDSTCSVEIIHQEETGGWTGRALCEKSGVPSLRVRGLETLACEVIVYWEFAGHSGTEVLGNEPRHFSGIGEQPERSNGFIAYLRLGWEHILEGKDHLAFVLGLLLLLTQFRTTVIALTAFTLGHAAALALALLGVWNLPTAWVECMIALSIVSLAIEALRDPKAAPGLSRKHPWAISLGFGLVHGLGFAGALREIGLPKDALWTPLIGFNFGVELGQLAFVGVAASLLWFFRVRFKTSLIEKTLAYGIGIVGVFWTVERGIVL